MILLAYLVTTAVLFFAAYIASVYALAVHIDPDAIRSLLPGISKRRRELIFTLARDPRALVQLAVVFRSLVLIVASAMTLPMIDSLVSGVILKPIYFYPLGLGMVWFVYLLVVEYLPRRASRRGINPKMTRYLWLIIIIYVFLRPVVSVYRQALKRVLPERKVTEEEKEEIVERAIETLADEAGIGEPIVEEDEKEMIGHIFLLDQTQVREIMSPRIKITGIDKSARFADIQDLVRRDGHSRYPVYEEAIDHIIGMLYVKDLFSNMPKPGEEFVIADYLRKPYFIPESKVISELQQEFQSRKQHIAIVVDEYGGVAGLVTLEDILEEIVGEIRDEHDVEEDEFSRQPDGSYLVDASLRMEKLQDYLDVDYEQEEDTLGGLIYDLVGSVPAEHTTIRWHDLSLEVMVVDGQRIKKVRVRKNSSNSG